MDIDNFSSAVITQLPQAVLHLRLVAHARQAHYEDVLHENVKAKGGEGNLSLEGDNDSIKSNLPCANDLLSEEPLRKRNAYMIINDRHVSVNQGNNLHSKNYLLCHLCSLCYLNGSLLMVSVDDKYDQVDSSETNGSRNAHWRRAAGLEEHVDYAARSHTLFFCKTK